MIEEGVYVEVVTQNIGTGGTSRTQEIKNYYMAKSVNDEVVQVQLMDMDDNPLPFKEEVPLADFNGRFEFVPEYLAKKKKSPQEQQVDKAIAQAEAHVKRKEFFSAEFEYNKALGLDEENVRANFGVGKVYLAQGDTEKARETFEKLAGIEAVFEDENKHIFNELGMELRRMKMYDQAIDYYTKALSIAQDDENLFFNVARAYFEKGEIKKSAAYLQKALKLNPNVTEFKQLALMIKKAAAS